MHLRRPPVQGPVYICVGVPGVSGCSSPFPVQVMGRFSIKNFTPQGQLFTMRVTISMTRAAVMIVLSAESPPGAAQGWQEAAGPPVVQPSYRVVNRTACPVLFRQVCDEGTTVVLQGMEATNYAWSVAPTCTL